MGVVATHKALILTAIFFLLSTGLEVSGYTNLPLAIVLWSVAGVCLFWWLWRFLPENPFQRKFMGPLILVVVGIVCLAAGGIWYFVSAERASSLPLILAETNPPLGTVAFVQFRVDVSKHKSTGTTDVQMRIELENISDSLIRYEMNRISGEVNGKTIPDPDKPRLDSTSGFIYPHKTAFFSYETITDVDISKGTISGTFEYDLSYSTVPPGVQRRSAKKLRFGPSSVDASSFVVNHLEEIEE